MLEPESTGIGQGKQVLNLLLAEMEKRRGSLIVVFAGYKNKMEKLFQYNEGLPSRFSNTVHFEDYSDEQLYDVFVGLMKKAATSQPLRFADDNDQWCRVAIRRLGAGRNSPGFGNARSVRNLFDKVNNRQAVRCSRDTSADPFTFTKSDLLGPSAAEAAKNSAAWKQLKSMIGLSQVKKSVDALYEVVKANELLELEMRPRQAVALNRLFLGNPGTGKTTVAQIYAEILRDFGLLSKGEVIMKAASDFIGNVLGESQRNTSAIIKSAEGCVLVIDEAYGLHGKDPYKTAAIDTIVEQVQGVPGEDRAVVLLGYREQMETMLRESNPGLQRRFQLENAFQFDDYNNDELLQILKLKMKKQGVEAGTDALIAAVKYLAVLRDTKPPFGNGGAVANLLSEAVNRKAARGAGTSPELIAEDFAPVDESAAADTDEKVLFKGLIGCTEIIQELRIYRATFLAAREKGQDPLKQLSLNFRFVGAPGTGKTTVAQRMGRMFRGLGVLPSADVVVVSGTDLVAGFVGQTAQKTRDVMDKGLGKVLFIDEAYSLATGAGGFGQEAIDELVRCMTLDKYMGKMVVIVAGYENDIDRLMKMNEGLRSRFDQVIHFPSFNLQDCCQLFNLVIASPEVDLKLSKESENSNAVEKQLQRLVNQPGFSNGRDIINWVKRLQRQMAMRRLNDDAETIEPSDLETTMNELLRTLSTARRAADGSQQQPPAAATPPRPPANVPPSAYQTQNSIPQAPPPPVLQFETAIKPVEELKLKKKKKKEKEDDGPHEHRHDHEHEHKRMELIFDEESFFGLKIKQELQPLNDLLVNKMKLSDAQVQELSTADLQKSQMAQQAIEQFTKQLGDFAQAMDIIRRWQQALQEALKKKKEHEEEMARLAAERQQRLKPIIQCQACGRTSNVWSPCPVAPKLIGYVEERVQTYTRATVYRSG
jgi:SpoVK/Ycf46/Vps4 family AAA+-type ATPase